MDFSDIKIIISEIDGILTNHSAGFGELNSILVKNICLKDFEAINLIKKDWGFVFLSSEATINMSLCKKRNIPFFYAERSKREVYNNILHKYSVIPDNILYVGSSYSDIECMRTSGISICPEDAVIQVKNVVDRVAPMYGGDGLLCYVYELLNTFRVNKTRGE